MIPCELLGSFCQFTTIITYMGDISIDDMFHNFMLHKMVQK